MGHEKVYISLFERITLFPADMERYPEMANEEFYIFLTSRDSLKFHPENKSHTFTVELPERLNLSGIWEVAICDFSTSEVPSETLMVFSDICDHSFVKDSLHPILRMILPCHRCRSHVFTNKYYVRVGQKSLGRIMIYIRDTTDQIPVKIR